MFSSSYEVVNFLNTMKFEPVMRTVDSVHRSEQEGGEEQRNGQTEHLDTVQTEVLHDVA